MSTSASTTRPTTFAHAPALDGLRGLAVLAVVVYHVWPDALPGGFIGVDVFFVLSGFLLSALLVREVEVTGRVAVGRFFVRRIRRLLPATILVAGALAAYAAFWANASELDRLRRHTIGALTYSINWLFVADGTTYTDVVLGASPLRHMWSLAIEEQFYIVLAVVVAGMAFVLRGSDPRRFGRRLAFGAAGLAAISAVWMVVLDAGGADLSRLYFGSDTRVQAMLIGVALGAFGGEALLSRPQGIAPQPIVALAGGGGLGVLAGAAFFSTEDASWMYRGGFTAVAVAAAVLIVGALTFEPMRWSLSVEPLVGLGAISYGVYLWHWPILVLLDESRLGIDGEALRWAQVGITLAVSIVSYIVVEQPIRRGAIGRAVGRGGVVLAPLAAVGVAVAMVLVTVPADAPPVDAAAAQTVDDPALADPDLLQVVAIGDSVMHTLIGGRLEGILAAVPWNQSQSSFDTDVVAIRTLARPACSFLPGEVAFEGENGLYETADLSAPCREWRDDLRSATDRPLSRDVTIVMPTNDLEDRLVDDNIVVFGTEPWNALMIGWLDEITSIAAAGDSIVVLIAPAPRLNPNWASPEGERESRIATMFADYASTHDGVESIDLGLFVGRDLETRYDGLHYSTDGARSVAAWLTPQLEAFVAR